MQFLIFKYYLKKHLWGAFLLNKVIHYLKIIFYFLYLLILDGTWLLPVVHWERPNPNPQARPILFYLVFCFLILLVSNDFCFCLRSSDAKFSAFVPFPCTLECLFLFFFAFYSACVWGGQPPPHPNTYTRKQRKGKKSSLECK